MHKFAIRAPLEEHRFLSRSLAVCECTYSLGGFVLETFEHLVHLEWTKCEHEPLAMATLVGCYKELAKALRNEDLHIWSRQIIHGLEAETCVFY